MALICWYCGEKEGSQLKDGTTVKIDALCHHCGKPLCEKHRISYMEKSCQKYLKSHIKVSFEKLQITDVEEKEKNSEIHSFHCKVCQKNYHSKIVRWKRILVDGYTAVRAFCVSIYYQYLGEKTSGSEPEPKKG